MLRKIVSSFTLGLLIVVVVAAQTQPASQANIGNAEVKPKLPEAWHLSDNQLREVVRQAIKPYMYGPEEPLHDYKYRMLVTTQELDKNLKPDPKETETELIEVKPVDGRPEEKVIERNGKPLTEKELTKQENDAAKSRKGRNRSVERAFIFGPEFMEAMDFDVAKWTSFDFARTEGLRLEVKFTPKKNPPKLKNDILKSLAGTLWINVYQDGCLKNPTHPDCGEFHLPPPTLTKYEMHLIKPVRLLGGIVISVSDMHLEVEMTPVSDKPSDESAPTSWLPKKMDIFLQLRFFGFKVRPKIKREYSAFERVLPRVIHGKELSPRK